MFEAIKVVDGQPFALTRHLERLARSARGLGLPDADLDGGTRGASRRCSTGERLPLGRLRITYTGGPAPLGLRPRRRRRRRWSWSPRRWSAWPETTAVATVPWPRNERGALAGLKTTSYAENVVALAEAARARAPARRSSPTSPGHLCEGTGTNVFYVVDGELRTPTLASGCLAGVTRRLVLEWYGGREVDEPIEVAGAGQRGLPGLHHPRRPGRRALGRPRARRRPARSPPRSREVWREREPELLGRLSRGRRMWSGRRTVR